MALPFTKMHGAGNDFVVLDLRDGTPLPERATLMLLADRHFGIGCDQIMVLQPARDAGSLASYRVINGDGSFARQCGNGARCLAAWLHRAGEFTTAATLDGPGGPIPIRHVGDDEFEVTLGIPAFAADAVPVRAPQDAEGSYRLDIDDNDIHFGALSVGNPHVVIVVADIAQASVALAGKLQHHDAFPDGCNVGFVQRHARDHLALRVIERGVGETLACGSGACAAHAWLRRNGLVDELARIDLPGGTLAVEWAGADEPVRLRGPTTFAFEGTWPT